MSTRLQDRELDALADLVDRLNASRPGVPAKLLVEVASLVPPHADVTVELRPARSTGAALVVVQPSDRKRKELLALLSPREREVAELVAEGARNREIAERLAIREGTVKDHVHRALTKLGCESRAELASMLGR